MRTSKKNDKHVSNVSSKNPSPMTTLFTQGLMGDLLDSWTAKWRRRYGSIHHVLPNPRYGARKCHHLLSNHTLRCSAKRWFNYSKHPNMKQHGLFQDILLGNFKKIIARNRSLSSGWGWTGMDVSQRYPKDYMNLPTCFHSLWCYFFTKIMRLQDSSSRQVAPCQNRWQRTFGQHVQTCPRSKHGHKGPRHPGSQHNGTRCWDGRNASEPTPEACLQVVAIHVQPAT